MALVVIGGNAAGMSAAARARRLDADLKIIVLEKGPNISYGTCGLPYLLEGRVRDPKQLIVYTPEYFRKERNVEVRTGTRVVSFSHARRQVNLESGGSLPYSHLVLATGARCDSMGIKGVNSPHVFTLHTIEDAERMRQFLREKQPRRAVVIGAGYIGLEAADALRRNGLQVTVLERSQNLLLHSDPDFINAVRKQLEAHGVELHCGVRVESIEPDRVAGYPCDMVILAAGFKPNVELAAGAGVELGRSGAIRTDERMETNLLGVYAAGDCAEIMHLVTGRPTYIPLGTSANKAGRVAGANAAGARERFPGVVGTSIVGIFGMAFATTGFSLEQARAEGFSPVATHIEAQARPRYFDGKKTTVQLVADRSTRRLLGGWVIGEEGAAGRIDVIATALHARLRLDDFEQLDLAYSPPFATVWDPLLIAAQQLLKMLR
ncbi:MAG TPA: FAD-dependent oxidoreductase [Bryobacteraceae bacterium]|nr:FAD-dependent oxidoreductase [Bryobacteraceae bacterium]